jgi:hypothetical protein
VEMVAIEPFRLLRKKRRLVAVERDLGRNDNEVFFHMIVDDDFEEAVVEWYDAVVVECDRQTVQFVESIVADSVESYKFGKYAVVEGLNACLFAVDAVVDDVAAAERIMMFSFWAVVVVVVATAAAAVVVVALVVVVADVVPVEVETSH